MDGSEKLWTSCITFVGFKIGYVASCLYSKPVQKIASMRMVMLIVGGCWGDGDFITFSEVFLWCTSSI